jgi:hypothetical protein
MPGSPITYLENIVRDLRSPDFCHLPTAMYCSLCFSRYCSRWSIKDKTLKWNGQSSSNWKGLAGCSDITADCRARVSTINLPADFIPGDEEQGIEMKWPTNNVVFIFQMQRASPASNQTVKETATSLVY